jgi:trans-aconitate methyltransferase
MIEDLEGERSRLARLAPDFSSEAGFNARLIDYRFAAIRPFVEGAEHCLELGSADGRMTALLAECVKTLVAVDGSADYVEAVRERLPHVTAICALFEEFSPAEPPDVAVLGHVLEHVAEPVALLSRVRSYLASDGSVVVTVPNADSLHRRAGVAMGLLSATTDLNEADLRIGHRRVYTRETLVADVAAAGLEPQHVSGIFLKPLSNAQIEEWTPELQDAFFELGKAHPELCAELLVVARGRDSRTEQPTPLAKC